MRKLIIHIFLILIISSPTVYAQVVMEPDLLIIGRDSLPTNGELILDTMMFYDQSKSALRGGDLADFIGGTNYWSPENIGFSSLSWGYNCLASGDGSIALGYNSKSQGTFGAIALGLNANATGTWGSTALGNNTLAHGDFGATALGYASEANGDFGATTIGDNTIANGDNCLAVGRYNDPMVSAGADITPTSPLFIIGNGDNNASSNAMVVRKDGRVGIGSNEPNATVEVSANSGSTATLELHEQSTTDFARLNFSNDSGPEAWTIAGRANPTNSQGDARLNFFYSDSIGNVLSLFGNGNATLKGNLTQSSDLRLKKDIVPLTNVMSQLAQLSGYTYHWKQSVDTKSQIGLIAQEVQRIYPELVREDEEGWLSVNYSKFVPILIEGIKEQASEISDLKNINTQILKRLEALEKITK